MRTLRLFTTHQRALAYAREYARQNPGHIFSPAVMELVDAAGNVTKLGVPDWSRYAGIKWTHIVYDEYLAGDPEQYARLSAMIRPE